MVALIYGTKHIEFSATVDLSDQDFLSRDSDLMNFHTESSVRLVSLPKSDSS